MPDYFAFGGCFRSELEFPDLSPSPHAATPDWEIKVSASSSPPDGTGQVLGEWQVEPGWVLRLFCVEDGWRLDYGASGSYSIRENGRRIVWYQGSDRREEVARAVILGPVMALALHASGLLCLHGSAVAAGGRGLGFLGSKGYGKSTLAMALAAAGGRLLSDDLVAVIRAPPPRIVPGVHSIRIREDVTRIVGSEFPDARVQEGWKGTLTNLPSERLAWEPVPLAVLYLIRPTEQKVRDVEREPLEARDAALALVRHTKLFPDLIGNQVMGTMLEWITELVAGIPVYHIDVPRTLERLPAVASRILSWHGDAAR